MAPSNSLWLLLLLAGAVVQQALGHETCSWRRRCQEEGYECEQGYCVPKDCVARQLKEFRDQFDATAFKEMLLQEAGIEQSDLFQARQDNKDDDTKFSQDPAVQAFLGAINAHSWELTEVAEIVQACNSEQTEEENEDIDFEEEIVVNKDAIDISFEGPDAREERGARNGIGQWFGNVFDSIVGKFQPDPEGDLTPEQTFTNTLRVRLGYNFVDGTTLRAATDEELAGLALETVRFYGQVMRDTYPTIYQNFEMSAIVQTFNPDASLARDEEQTAPFTVSVDFTATVSFSFDGVTSPPSDDQVFSTMVTANYEDYRLNYVLVALPSGSIFGSTSQVRLPERLSTDPTAAPTPAPTLPTVSRDLRVRLGYNFVDGTTLREATQVEIDVLVSQTLEFYRKLMSDTYPTIFRSFDMSAIVQTFDPDAALARDEEQTAPFTISVDFTATSVFTVDFVTPVPSDDQVFSTMVTANYEDYRVNYVLVTPPGAPDGSIFLSTSQVRLPERLSLVPTPAPTPAPTITETLRVRLGYDFFANTTIREATQEEIDGLVVETTRWYTDVMTAAYPTIFQSFSMSGIVQNFDPDADEQTRPFPITLDFTSTVVFVIDPPPDPPNTDQIFSTMLTANYEDYRQNYVRVSEPLMTSLFFSTSQVRLPNLLPTVPTPAPTTAAPSLSAAPSQVPSSTPSVSPSLSQMPTKVEAATEAPSSSPSSAPSNSVTSTYYVGFHMEGGIFVDGSASLVFASSNTTGTTDGVSETGDTSSLYLRACYGAELGAGAELSLIVMVAENRDADAIMGTSVLAEFLEVGVGAHLGFGIGKYLDGDQVTVPGNNPVYYEVTIGAGFGIGIFGGSICRTNACDWGTPPV